MKSIAVALALVCSVGSLVLAGASSVLGVLVYGPKIVEQQNTINELKAQLELSKTATTDNLKRINELDAGLTALIDVSGADVELLAGAMKDESPTPSEPNIVPAPVAGAILSAADSEFVNESSSVPVNDDVFDEFISEIGEGNPPGGEVVGAAPSAVEPVPLAIPSELVKPAHVDSILARKISSNWIKPGGDSEGLKTVVTMKLARDGSLVSVEVTKSSGNRAFDDSAIIAIQKIGNIDEVAGLSDEDYETFYAERALLFATSVEG
tara:strand:+ start:7314 stop:8111 length:798 start_codon:yes stop_codon:yes gene_type:complete